MFPFRNVHTQGKVPHGKPENRGKDFAKMKSTNKIKEIGRQDKSKHIAI